MRCVPVIALGLALCGLVASAAGAASRSGNGCALGTMTVRLGAAVSEKTGGQETLPLVITDHASGRCVLHGYPALALFDHHGRKIPFQYTHRGDEMITGARPKPVTMRQGTSAYFALNKTFCNAHTTRNAHTVRVAVPGSHRTKTVHLRHYPILNYCGRGFFGRVDVSPFERHPYGWAASP